MHNNRIKKFISDVETQTAVQRFLIDHVLKSNKSTDVNYLAGKMIAVEMINSAWKEMGKQVDKKDVNTGGSSQVGL